MLAQTQDPAVRALAQIRPGAQWTMSGGDCSTLVWLDAVQTAPSCAEISAAAAALPTADTAEASRKAGIQSDAQRAALLAKLKSASNADIHAYVTANVTNLAQVQVAIENILKLIALDARQ